jgi:sterol desaturase/sphingolipid hydroxylase (fatty acid hydroxylase superfamily)
VAQRKLDLIDQLTLPAFAVTMLLEYRVLRRRARETALAAEPAPVVDDALPIHELPADPIVPIGYERKDTAASLGMLAGSLAVGFALYPVFDRFERLLFRHRIANLGKRRSAFVGSMLLWDFLYYWDHRWMHEVRVMWAHHVNHHSSERYNLSTALRQPWSPFVSFWTFAPMPLLGYSPAQIAKAGQLNLLYQYWIHTEAVDRLPAPLETVLNTPSHHRVHHGAQKQYLDKNYGGILIVWDRLFGTFEPEIRRVRYGLTKNIHTFNPVRIAYHEFADIARDVRTARSPREALRYVFGRPGWKPADLTPAPVAAGA